MKIALLKRFAGLMVLALFLDIGDAIWATLPHTLGVHIADGLLFILGLTIYDWGYRAYLRAAFKKFGTL